MEIGEWVPQKAWGNARTLVARLSKYKTAYTLSTVAYCAVHWLFTHSVSVYMASGALVFGAIAATSIAWLSGRYSSTKV